jgi:TetR/AcrR family transcriptional repressor of nem operon
MSGPRTKELPAATSTRILDVAERLTQTRGFNGFSYADVAAELAITKAALHYHFPAKEALGLALIERYTTQHRAALESIGGGTGDALQSLRRYADLYADVLRGGRMCLCGMLAAEYTTLPDPMQAGIRAFFDFSVSWVAGVLGEGRRSGAFDFTGDPAIAANSLVSALEGALLVARPFADLARFRSAAARVLGAFTARPAADGAIASSRRRRH